METLEETKAYNARQPRDDHGKWSDGAGGISVGHAIHVAKSEGIGEKHHAGIREGIASGNLDTREKVLAHIDAIHGAGKAPSASVQKEIDNAESGVKDVINASKIDGKIDVNDVVNTAHAIQKLDGSDGDLRLHHVLEAINYHWKGATPQSTALTMRSDVSQHVIGSRSRKNAHSSAVRAEAVVMALQGNIAKAKEHQTRTEPDEKKSLPDDTLIAFGEGIKSVEETADSYKFGAFLVVFDSPDISNYRDSFTKSTDFGFEDGDTRPILYNHGLDGTFGKSTIGKARLYLKDAGVWMEGEIKKRKDYLEKHIERVGEGLKATVRHRGIEAPMFGASSGSAAHSVVREAKGTGHEIKQWFLAEASITPTPAEPQTACMSLKSLIELEETEGADADEWKKYDARQPRDDAGRWSEGGASTGLTAGHAVAVMRAEGITDEASHAEVTRAIEAGVHTSPEQVLRHIDRIHVVAAANAAMNGAAQPLGSRVGAMADAARVQGARDQQAAMRSAKTPEEALTHIHPDLQKRLSEVTAGENATVKQHARDKMLSMVAPELFKAPKGGGDKGERGRGKAETAMLLARAMDQNSGTEAMNGAKEAHEMSRADYEAIHGKTPVGSIPAHSRLMLQAAIDGKYIPPEAMSGGVLGFAVTGIPESYHPKTRDWIIGELEKQGYKKEEIPIIRNKSSTVPQPATRGPSQGDLQRAVTQAHASVAAAHGVRQKIMDARNASLQLGRRVTKSDDEDDLDALFEAWGGHAAAALEVLQTELAPLGAAPQEVKSCGAYDPFEIGRYVQSRLANSGVILGATN